MRDFLRQCRPHFLNAGLFSFFINVLMLTVPIYMLQVYDRVLSSRSTETLWLLTVLAVGAILAYLVLDSLRSRLLLAAGVSLEGLAGPVVLDGVLKNAGRTSSSQCASGVKDIATVRSFLSGAGIVSLFDAPWFPVYLAVICMFHWQLGVAAAVGTVLIIALAVLNEICTKATAKDVADRARNASRHVDSSLRSAEIINVLGMQNAFQCRWQALNRAVIDGAVILSRKNGLFTSLTKFMRLLLQVMMLAIGAHLVIAQNVTAGVMLAATLVLARALAPVEAVVAGWRALIEARAAYDRLGRLLAAEGTEAASVIPVNVQGQLSVEKVAYSPPGSDRLTVKGVTFNLVAGESLGLIGPSASGKSTLARLVVGSWQPSTGTVRLDGADIAYWPKEQLGPLLGYVPQDVQLLNGTVAENITRFSDADSEAVIAAAKRAQAHELILRLPKGYDTEAGDNGCMLSGGQRQFIGIARALFGNPKLVVMDEPNANLDGDGEARLAQAIDELRVGGTTVIVISHRPSLLTSVDKLLLLKDGKIELFGPRQEVLAQLHAASVVPLNLAAQLSREARTA